jgi:HPt (histidine-containing phosphotransfer) domain-containing protein
MQPAHQHPNPPVDLQRLASLADTSSELRELLELYLRETEKQLNELFQAIQQNDAPRVRSIAHSCAGASATCGMVSIIRPMEELENCGREGDLSAAWQLHSEASAEFRLLTAFLENYLASQR